MPYSRVLLKLSGEALGSAASGRGIELEMLQRLARQVADAVRSGAQIVIVVGGGNLLRGAELSARGAQRASADYMGMLATVINSVALCDAIEAEGLEARVLSAIDVRQVAEPFVRRRALRHLERGRVVILAGGLGAPCFTTDTAAAQRAIELNCDVLLKATKVDGVYTADPRKDPTATRYETVTFQECLSKRLNVMDATAFSLCMDNDIPIIIFDLGPKGNLSNALRGQQLGTLVHGEDRQ